MMILHSIGLKGCVIRQCGIREGPFPSAARILPPRIKLGHPVMGLSETVFPRPSVELNRKLGKRNAAAAADDGPVEENDESSANSGYVVPLRCRGSVSI